MSRQDKIDAVIGFLVATGMLLAVVGSLWFLWGYPDIPWPLRLIGSGAVMVLSAAFIAWGTTNH